MDQKNKSWKIVGGRKVLNMDWYTPALLTILTNRLSSGASVIYLERFKVGIADWRVISMLAIEPHIRVNRISSVTSMDKAAISRSLAGLYERRLVSYEQDKKNPRKKMWRLTGAGENMHDQILEVALAREKGLLRGLSAEDIDTFNELANKMIANLREMDKSK